MKTILASLVLLLSSSSFAALPKTTLKATENLQLAQEILSLPEVNRKQVAQEKAEELFPALIALSKSPDQVMATRWKALTLAAYINKEKSVSELEANLKSPEWFMRNAALVSLKNYHPLKVKAAARTLLKDKALVVRSAAVEVLVSDLDQSSRDLLWEEFQAPYNFRKKQSLWIRGQILSHLAATPKENESLLFLKALQEKESTLHPSAMIALEKITQKTVGKPNQKTAEKRTQWLEWAKNNPKALYR